MKKLVALSIFLFLLTGLAACVGSSAKMEVRAKCPACGYEFDSPS